LNHQDKLIHNLRNRLDLIDPSSCSIDTIIGFNIWKEKRIIPTTAWKRMVTIYFNNGLDLYYDLSRGLDLYPDSYIDVVFRYNIEGAGESFREVNPDKFKEWIEDYIELLEYKKDSHYGNTKCQGCLLNPLNGKSGLLVGIYKILRSALNEKFKDKVENNKSNHNFQSISPQPMSKDLDCLIVDKFRCPYDNKEKTFKHNFDTDIDFLYYLNEISMKVEYALMRTLDLTKNHKTTSEEDLDKSIPDEIKTIVTIKDIEGIQSILTNKDTLDKILKQGLELKEYEEWKDNILDLFEKIKINQ